jgi:hypothetical protein
MAEELVPTAAFGLRGADQNIWHIAAAERWSDRALIGYQTRCGRNYPESVLRSDLDGLDDVCSDCVAQVARHH